MDANAKTRLSEQHLDPLVGRTFGGYRIEGVIGRGGMGTVYLARQLSLGRPVAIKVLPKDLASEEQFLERFHREADALSRLSHSSIVAVFDRGDVDGQPYLVMEYVEGSSLREAMKNGPLPLAEALRIATAVLQALDHAHEKAIVHRDIKPENILISRDGVVKVADFGLSKLLGPEDQTRLTRTQLVLGTYEYMAPEQRERAKEADPRSDLYATTVVLYEMLAGELPIGRFALPSRRRPEDCDGRVDALIERGLEKNPAMRFQRALEMADAIEAILRSPQPKEKPSAPHAPPAYGPSRLEHHIDNLATIDHVLGTIGYVLGFVVLFRGIEMAKPAFILFFVAGWYLRQTAEGLRKYRPSARTSQAVIAILGAPLLPFSIYSFWVLFSHRGRTYYEARGRGLDEHAAARHTHRILEEPYTPPAPRPPPPLRPSAIPVQSIVTSEVREEPFAPRRSKLVSGGLWCLFTTFLASALMLFGNGVLPERFHIGHGVGFLVLAGVGLTVLLLALGFFHAVVSSRATGAGAAVLGLLACGLASVMTLRSVESPSPTGAPFEIGAWPGPNETYLGRYLKAPPTTFEHDFFNSRERVEWLRQEVGSGFTNTRLTRRSGKLYVQYDAGLERTLKSRLALAVQHRVEFELGADFESSPLE